MSMYGWIQIWLQKDYLGLIVRRKKIQNSSHKCMKWNERKPRTVLLVAWKRDCKNTRQPPPCFLTSVLGNIFTWRHHDATQCVIWCFHKNNNIFFSQFFFIKYYMMRLLKYIELAPFYWNLSQSEKLSWVFNKNTDKQNRCAISSHKLKSQRIYYYYLSYFLTLHIFRHSKIFKNDKNYSVCTLLNPFYFVCCLFIWTVKIVCWIGT